MIQKYRDEYTKAVLEVPLANKRKRLDEFQNHYEKHMKDGSYIKAQSVLRDIKSEMEEKISDVSFHFTQITEYHDMKDEDLLAEKMKTLDQLEKIKKLRSGDTRILEGEKNGD